MENEFVSYEQAIALKELGFGAPPLEGFQQGSVFYFENGKLYYDGHPMYSSTCHEGIIMAPLKQQVFRWFREKYSLEIILCPDCFNEPSKLLREYKIISIDKSIILDQCTDQKHWIRKGCFVSYEEAENACIDKLIEIVKQQKDGK